VDQVFLDRMGVCKMNGQEMQDRNDTVGLDEMYGAMVKFTEIMESAVEAWQMIVDAFLELWKQVKIILDELTRRLFEYRLNKAGAPVWAARLIARHTPCRWIPWKWCWEPIRGP
jgi:hypothetical protein